MTESKLLVLVNSRSVVCQPWTNHPTLAKKVVYSWKNGILKRVRTLFQLTENDQKFSSCACSIYLPAMPSNSQDFRHNALNWDKNDSPVLGALQCGPHVVQALKSPMELSNKIPTSLPWTNQSYSQVCCANKVSPPLPSASQTSSH